MFTVQLDTHRLELGGGHLGRHQFQAASGDHEGESRDRRTVGKRPVERGAATLKVAVFSLWLRSA